MFKNKKGFILGLICGMLIMSLMLNVFAAPVEKIITAMYNDIKIYIDGVKIEPKDANGNTVEPFVYNGTTYLPVRAVGQAFGKSVEWDGATQSVYIGEKPGEVQYIVDVCPPYDGKNYKTYTSQNGKNFTMSGKQFSNGISFSDGYSSFALFNLDGKYKTLTFTVGHVDGTSKDNVKLQVYLDDKLSEEIELKHDSVYKTVTIDLKYALSLKLSMAGGMGGNWSNWGLGDIIIK